MAGESTRIPRCEVLFNYEGSLKCRDCEEKFAQATHKEIEAQGKREAEEKYERYLKEKAEKQQAVSEFERDYLTDSYDAKNSDYYEARARFRKLGSSEQEMIAEKIKRMKYGDFLRTPYWRYCAAEVRRKSGGICSLCGSGDGHFVHHSTYYNHGREIDHLEDLFLLCHDCHEKFHEETIAKKKAVGLSE